MHQRTLNKEKILTTLLSEVNNETRYLVASFGPRINSKNYEIFAEAAAQL
jgi:copper oxidase (laccase) domain-containing protein